MISCLLTLKNDNLVWFIKKNCDLFIYEDFTCQMSLYRSSRFEGARIRKELPGSSSQEQVWDFWYDPWPICWDEQRTKSLKKIHTQNLQQQIYFILNYYPWIVGVIDLEYEHLLWSNRIFKCFSKLVLWLRLRVAFYFKYE